MNQITRRESLFATAILALALCVFMIFPAFPAYGKTGSFMAADAEIDTMNDSSEVAYADVGLILAGKTKDAGWDNVPAGGSVVGDVGGKGLKAFAVQLSNVQGISGSISYRAYKRGSGWMALASDGEGTIPVRSIEAVRINLSGEVADHYDVLYRAFVSGRGWQPWEKNGVASGVVGEGARVNAIQVKLSAKTLEARNSHYTVDSIGLRYEVRTASTGWQSWTGNGRKAGTTGKQMPLTRFALLADCGNLPDSGVRYRAYNSSTGWQDWRANGSVAGTASQNLECVRIELTGAIKKSFDVYYRAHVQHYGWLGWAKNGKQSGSTGYGAYIDALQVKLVAKGDDAPGRTSYPKANELEKAKTLDGIDVSSWQGDINLYNVAADFTIVKATQGNWYKNPYFTQQADAALGSGKLLGTYHFADLEGSAIDQADYYVEAVEPYLSQCVLVLDWEAEALDLGPTWAKAFLDRVYERTGVKPLIYLSQSSTHDYDWSEIAGSYKLWLAQYLYSNMDSNGFLKNPNPPWSIGYWRSAVMYQYSSTGWLNGYGSSLDLNKFYGGVLSWDALCMAS